MMRESPLPASRLTRDTSRRLTLLLTVHGEENTLRLPVIPTTDDVPGAIIWTVGLVMAGRVEITVVAVISPGVLLPADKVVRMDVFLGQANSDNTTQEKNRRHQRLARIISRGDAKPEKDGAYGESGLCSILISK